jgi:5-hydroxyisourate hydrolase
MSISVRVLDWVYGRPAADMGIRLSRDRGGEWHEEARGRTDVNGYLADLPPGTMTRGIHRLDVDLDEYFAGIGVMPFYPRITIIFRVTDLTASYHIPVLITPHAYATYSDMPPGGSGPEYQGPSAPVPVAEVKEDAPDEVSPARPHRDPPP